MSISSLNPSWLRVEYEAIPAELVSDPAWYVWRGEPRHGHPGKFLKPPRHARTGRRAQWRAPSTGSSFGDAFMRYERDLSLNGIGYVLHSPGRTGIDLDNALTDDGEIKPWAEEIVSELPGAYFEVSPSGRGLHGFCRAVLPPGPCKRQIGRFGDGACVELYDEARFFTVTGHAFQYVERLPNLQAAVDGLHAKLFGDGTLPTGAFITRRTGHTATLSVDGARLWDRVLASTRADQILRVWGRSGLDSDYDWMIARELAFHGITLGYADDELGEAIESVMRAGPWRPKRGPWRPKWDSGRPAVVDGVAVRTTYLGLTIGRAISATRARLAARAPRGGRTGAGPAVATDPPTDEATPPGAAKASSQAMESLIADQQAIIRAHQLESRQQAALHEQTRIHERDCELVRRNQALQPSERALAIALVREVESAKSRGLEEANPHYPDLAQIVGVSKRTIIRLVPVLTDGDDAPFVKRTVTEMQDVRDSRTGRVVRRPTSRTYIRARRKGPLLEAIAAFHPDRPQHGGRRVPLRAVPEDLSTAVPAAPARSGLRPSSHRTQHLPPVVTVTADRLPPVVTIAVEPSTPGLTIEPPALLGPFDSSTLLPVDSPVTNECQDVTVGKVRARQPHMRGGRPGWQMDSKRNRARRTPRTATRVISPVGTGNAASCSSSGSPPWPSVGGRS